MMVLNPERLLIRYASRLAISKNGYTGKQVWLKALWAGYSKLIYM